MKVVALVLILLVWTIYRVAVKRGKYHPHSLSPLSPETKARILAIRRAKEQSLIFGIDLAIADPFTLQGTVSLAELRTAWSNTRALACELDGIRLEDSENREEFEQLYCQAVYANRKITSLFMRACSEWAANLVMPYTSQLYANSVLALYDKQIFLATNLLQLSGDNRFTNLEDHSA